MKWKLNRNRTAFDRERIKSLEEQMAETTARLDAAVAESKRLSRQLEEHQHHDHMSDLRRTLKKRHRTAQPSDLHTYNPDDTVN